MTEQTIGEIVIPKFPSEITGLSFENDLKFITKSAENEKELQDKINTSRA